MCNEYDDLDDTYAVEDWEDAIDNSFCFPVEDEEIFFTVEV